jgi:hypothetical protein
MIGTDVDVADGAVGLDGVRPPHDAARAARAAATAMRNVRGGRPVMRTGHMAGFSLLAAERRDATAGARRPDLR